MRMGVRVTAVVRLSVRVALGERREARDGVFRGVVDVLRHQSDVDGDEVGGECGLKAELVGEDASGEGESRE